MKCPKCSGEAITCQVAYEQGTTNSKSQGKNSWICRACGNVFPASA